MDVVDLKPDQIPLAGELLARAFSDDGLAVHMYPDEAERRARIPWHFSAMVRYGVLFGRVLTTPGDPLGVAVWLAPGETAMTDDRIMAAGMDASAHVLGEEAFGRFMAAMQHIEGSYEQDVPSERWHLALIGVHPDHAGRGVGSTLIRSVLRAADRQRLPCYLETANARNVPFYEGHGFATIRNGTVPDTAVDYWVMRRHPVM